MSNEYVLYHYDPSTGEKTAEGTIDLDKYGEIPPNSTIKQPPKDFNTLNPDESLWFDEVTDEWILEVDANYVAPDNSPSRLDEVEMAIADILGGM